jgi:hypothetical protein
VLINVFWLRGIEKRYQMLVRVALGIECLPWWAGL